MWQCAIRRAAYPLPPAAIILLSISSSRVVGCPYRIRCASGFVAEALREAHKPTVNATGMVLYFEIRPVMMPEHNEALEEGTVRTVQALRHE